MADQVIAWHLRAWPLCSQSSRASNLLLANSRTGPRSLRPGDPGSAGWAG